MSPSHKHNHLKFIHEYLPLGKRRYQDAKVKTEELKLCPCCRSHEVHLNHFLRYSENPDFQASLATLRSDIQTKDVHPVRYIIYYQGLHHWFTTEGIQFSPSLSEYPSKFTELLSKPLTAQATMGGWDKAFKGFLSRKRAALAQHGMHDQSRDRRSGDTRIRCILRGIHAHTRRLWLARNSVLHSENDTILADIRSKEIAEIKYYHSRPHLLFAADQHYCECSLSRLISASSSTRRRWLKNVKRSSAELTKDGTRQARITNFFAPIQLVYSR